MPKEKEKELSLEEKKFVNLAKHFLRQASIATKNFRMFGENHPILLNSIRNINELLKSSLEGRTSITYTFLESAFLVEDIPLKGLDLKAYSFITDLKESGITSLTFLPGIDEEELKLLLKSISSGPAYLKQEGGIINIFKRKNIEHIKADEIYFKRISKKEEEDQIAKAQLADMLTVNFLLGKTSISEGEAGVLAKEISLNPKKIGDILSRVSKEAGKGGKVGGFTCSNIDRLISHIKGTGEEPDETITKNIGNIILALEPSLRSEVLRSDVTTCKESATIKSAISAFSDEVVVKIIISEFAERNSSVAETKKLIQRLLPDPTKRRRVFSILEKKLLQKGVSQKTCSELLEEKFWIDMTDDEKVKAIEKHDPVYCVETGIADEIRNLIDNLLTEKKFTSVQKIVDKILDNLSSGDVDFKIRTIRDFECVAVLVFQSPDYPNKEAFLKRIGKECQNTKEKEIRARFSRLVVPLLNICMRNKCYENIPYLISIAGYESVKDDMFRETTLDEFLKGLFSIEKTDKKLIKDLARAIGKDAESALGDILISIKEDDFDSYKKRHTIAEILKEMGSDAEVFLIEKLSSDNVRIIKNSLEALSEIGTEKSIPPIKELLGRKDKAIQKQAEVALKNIEKRLKK